MAIAKRNSNVKSAKPVQNGSYRIFDDIMALASTMMRSRKDFGAEKLQSLATATRDYATSLTDLPTMRAHVESASESIEGMASYVMHTDVEHMAHDAAIFVRRHPLATLGLTVGAGIAASQLFRPARTTARVNPIVRRAKKKAVTSAARARKAVNGSAHAHA
jgi:hypothetical protein